MNANQGLLPVQTGASFPKLDTGHPQPHISQITLGFRHDICAKTLEFPALLTIPCQSDRGTQWVTAKRTPCASISTGTSSWSFTARPSPVTPDSWPTANLTTPSA